MFFVQRYNYDVQYATIFDSFHNVFASFVGGPEDTENWLDVLFGITAIVVLGAAAAVVVVVEVFAKCLRNL